MAKDKQQPVVESATTAPSPLAPDILIAFREHTSSPPIFNWRANKSVGDGWIDFIPGIAPQSFFRTRLSANMPGCYNLQCYYGSSNYLWLAGETSNQHVWISEAQGDPRCNWFIEKSPNPYDPSYRVRFYKDTWVTDQVSDRPRVDNFIIGLVPESQTSGFKFLLQYFHSCPDMSWAPVTHARILGIGYTMCGDPSTNVVSGVSGIEELPPLKEVWYVQKTREPSWYVIVVVSELDGPRCLAGNSQGSKVWLTEDPNSDDALWFIEPYTTDLFMISKSASGQGPWLKMSYPIVTLSTERYFEWMFHTLVTAE